MQTDRRARLAEYLEWEAEGQGLSLALFGNLLPEGVRQRHLAAIARARQALEAKADEEVLRRHRTELREVAAAVAVAVQQLL